MKQINLYLDFIITKDYAMVIHRVGNRPGRPTGAYDLACL